MNIIFPYGRTADGDIVTTDDIISARRKLASDPHAASATPKAAIPEPAKLPSYTVTAAPSGSKLAIPASLLTVEERAVAKQMGISIEDLEAYKRNEKTEVTTAVGLTPEELLVAKQMGLDPAEVARSKAAE